VTAVGEVSFRRRYFQCTCSREGSYAADELLGIEGKRSTKTVQKHCCKLAAELSFAGTHVQRHLRPPLRAMGTLLGHGRLITPRETGCTPPPFCKKLPLSILRISVRMNRQPVGVDRHGSSFHNGWWLRPEGIGDLFRA
jgi:hypothetical protein